MTININEATDLHNQGYSWEVVARKLGTTRKTLRDKMRNAGIMIKPALLTENEKTFTIEAYKCNVSQKSIAAQLGRCERVIHNELSKQKVLREIDVETL